MKNILATFAATAALLTGASTIAHADHHMESTATEAEAPTTDATSEEHTEEHGDHTDGDHAE